MDEIFEESVSGLTLKRTMCSMICALVDILIGVMDGEDELRRRLTLNPREMGEEYLSFNGDKKCRRVHSRSQIILAWFKSSEWSVFPVLTAISVCWTDKRLMVWLLKPVTKKPITKSPIICLFHNLFISPNCFLLLSLININS